MNDIEDIIGEEDFTKMLADAIRRDSDRKRSGKMRSHREPKEKLDREWYMAPCEVRWCKKQHIWHKCRLRGWHFRMDGPVCKVCWHVVPRAYLIGMDLLKMGEECKK
jgi:hypothetical protein